MGTFSSRLDPAAFVELGGTIAGGSVSGAAYVTGSHVPDRPDGATGATTVTFFGLDGTQVATTPVLTGGYYEVSIDGVDFARASLDGTLANAGGVLLSDEFRGSLGDLADQVSAAVSTSNSASAQALQAVSDAMQATQDANAAAQTAQTAAQQAQQASAATGLFVKKQNADGSLPTRGRSDGVCIWVSRTKPPIAAGYAQAGDIWIRIA